MRHKHNHKHSLNVYAYQCGVTRIYGRHEHKKLADWLKVLHLCLYAYAYVHVFHARSVLMLVLTSQVRIELKIY